MKSLRWLRRNWQNVLAAGFAIIWVTFLPISWIVISFGK